MRVVLGLFSYYFLSTFSYFFNLHFPGLFSIRIDILWVQLLLKLSTDHFEIMHTCFTRSEDVRVVLGLFCHYFFPVFRHSLF